VSNGREKEEGVGNGIEWGKGKRKGEKKEGRGKEGTLLVLTYLLTCHT